MDLLLTLSATYLVLGLCFAIPFVWKGVAKLDPSAQGGTWGFRALILPGSVLLWPWLAGRWLKGAEAPLESTPHKLALGRSESGGRP